MINMGMVFGALCLGIGLGAFVGYAVFFRVSTSGAIRVIKDGHKLVYSLELESNPETLQFKKTVHFKVVQAEPDEDRD